jgi:shikimate kinase
VALFVISGVSAAGKSTVARLLAERFQHGVCVLGDAIRAMMVSGRVDMRPDAGAEALRQLALRYSGTLAGADVFLGAGFGVVVEDVIIGPILGTFSAWSRCPSSTWCSWAQTRRPSSSENENETASITGRAGGRSPGCRLC